MALVIGVSLGSLVVSGTLSWLRFRQAFQQQVADQLTSVRASKGKQLETYLGGLQSHVATLSEDRMFVGAMVELNSGYRNLQNQTISDQWLKNIGKFYSEDFLPKLAKNVESIQIVSNYRPTTQAGQYLQHHYIVTNKQSEKMKLDKAEDGSVYTKVHAQYHPIFRNLIQQFSYEDLYLIDFNSGHVIYSVNKKPDFGTSLDRGPYRRSNLAAVVEAVRNDPGKGFVKAADYKPYVPAYSAPTAFVAAPIYNGHHIVGILAVQFPTQAINTLLTGTQEWEKDGLGKTGQVYVVGDDFLMRSIDRSLVEDPKNYAKRLERIGLSPQTLNLVQQLNTSTLLHPIRTDAAKSALSGVIETRITDDYRGVSVLSSHAPLRLKGLRWAILAEMEESEAFSPVTSLQMFMSILGVVLILIIAWVVHYAALGLVKPIHKLLEITGKIRFGQWDVDIDLGNDSNLEPIGTTFNYLLQEIKAKETLVTEQAASNEALIKNIVPAAVSGRISPMKKVFTDSLQQATLIVIRITGLRQLGHNEPPEVVAEIYHQLVTTFDQKAKFYGLETQPTLDDIYIAVCGISQVFLDHQERTVNFALELVRFMENESEEFPAELDLQIGIHSGPLMTGVVGTSKFMYKLWGETFSVAMALNPHGGANNSILVTRPIHDRLQERYLLVPRPPLELQGMDPVPIWMVFTRTTQFIHQVELVQTSFSKLLPQAASFSALFFSRFHEVANDAHPLFQGEQASLEKQFMDNLTSIIRGLNSLDKLLPTLRNWGHSLQNCTDTEYNAVCEVLLWTLEKKLGPDFTPDIDQAWGTIYTILSGVIKEAAMIRKARA